MALSGFAYPVAGVLLLRRSQDSLRQSQSRFEWVYFDWLTIWLAGHLIAFLVIFVAQSTLNLKSAMPIASWVMAAEVFYLGVLGVWRGAGWTPPPTKLVLTPSVSVMADSARLKAVMQESGIYKEPGLSLAQLAEASGLAEASVTAAVKASGAAHFFDFVNGYRCEFVKSRLADPEASSLTLLEIAHEAGFNSKSAFNRVFKAQEGMTPSAFRSHVCASIGNEDVPLS